MISRCIQMLWLAALPAVGLVSRAQVTNGAPDWPPVVAFVNGHKITGAALARRVMQSRSMDPERFDGMTAEQKKQGTVRVLRALVLQELEYQEAIRRNIVVSEEEIEAVLHRERRSDPGLHSFEQSLNAGQITLAEWKQELRKARMITRLEEKAAAGMPRFQWVEHRKAWLQRLVANAQIWTWQP